MHFKRKLGWDFQSNTLEVDLDFKLNIVVDFPRKKSTSGLLEKLEVDFKTKNGLYLSF